MTKIHLYLDIDGVLNAWERDPRSRSLWKGGYKKHNLFYGERVAPAMVARLNGLIADHGIVGHWLTTWMDAAPAFGSAIGLAGSEDWPILDAVEGDGSVWPKWSSIRAHVGLTRPDLAVWIDDDLAHNMRARRWAVAARVACWVPEGVHAITPVILDQIEATLREAG